MKNYENAFSLKRGIEGVGVNFSPTVELYAFVDDGVTFTEIMFENVFELNVFSQF